MSRSPVLCSYRWSAWKNQGVASAVIEALRLALREQVGDEAVANVLGEGVQDAARLRVAAGQQRQPLEADHRVAPPVGEPGVAGDDGARLVPLGVQPHLVGRADARRDDELIGGQHQLGPHAVLQDRVRLRDEARPPLVVQADGRLGPDLAQALPGLGRGRELGQPARRHRQLEPPQRPQLAAPLVPARALDAIDDVQRPLVARQRHRRFGPGQQAQGRQARRATGGGHLDAVADRLHAVGPGRLVDAPLVRAHRDGRLQPQLHRPRRRDQPVGDARGVLAVGHDHPLLQHHPLVLEPPDGASVLDAKVDQVLREERAGGPFEAGQPELVAVGGHHRLDQVVQHQHAPQRRRQRGHQQPMRPARRRGADGPRRVAAQAVGQQPLAPQQRVRRFAVAPGAAARRASAHDSASGTSTTAAWPGNTKPASVSTGAVPWPP